MTGARPKKVKVYHVTKGPIKQKMMKGAPTEMGMATGGFPWIPPMKRNTKYSL